MTIDTNIIIAYLDGESTIIDNLSNWKKQGRIILLPTIVESEVLSFPEWTKTERMFVEKYLEENFISIPFSRTIARKASNIRCNIKIKLPDAAIAATAMITNKTLITRNIKDFKHVNELSFVKI